MSRRPEFRFVLVDLAIILALTLVGWAAYRLAHTEPQITAAQHQTAALQDIFREGQQLLRENTNDLELARRESDLAWYDALLLKQEYFGLAERLEKSLPPLQNAMARFPETRSELPADLRALQAWIGKEKERVFLDRLESRSKTLQERMAQTQSENTNAPIVLAEDLGSVVNRIDETIQNCLAEIVGAIDNAGKPLVGAIVAQRLERARQDVGRLSSYADQARRDALAINKYLETQTGTDSAKRRRRQEELLRAFSEVNSPAELTERLPSEAKPDSSVWAPEVRALRATRYALLAAMAGLGVFLILDLYWRLVVVPLRFKLMQREGQIEQQKKLAHFEELAAELAHEIRNPLTAISALLYTVQRKLQSGTPEHKDSTVIRNELDHVNQILKEFIQMTRPAPPKLELMSAGPLLKEVSDLMARELQTHAVRLERDTPGHAQFYGDQQQLKQVLINLIQNAAESFEGSRENQGAVVLRARDDKIPLNGEPAKVAIIEVEDNGPGIRPEVQVRLFEPFFSTKKSGTGLGLPISARIIDRHGGKLDVETQVGHGTTFRIVLPAYEQRN